MIPILDQAIATKLTDSLNLQLADNTLSWELGADANYTMIQKKDDQEEINSQMILENYINKIYKKNTKTASSDTLSNKDKKILK
jgi:polyphosphate kinase